ncbi:YccT family protein [Sansalvadorimonas verongulae]|uniref:YccT family protein n=1 Tax=Sansalvadorimonas verongulae TaxID=2172824 RepID=UPI0012BD745E|nr:DUF2057 domain-containing protein [Sansalvadorimonas verongulae]MTI15339.1 DUF2057 domain-containing protein [Sansalvadorimonas verongulae]
MNFVRLLAMAASLAAGSVWAADLTVANNLDIHVVNGQKYNAPVSLFAGKNVIDLGAGDQQLVLRVSDSFGTRNSQELYKSEYYVLTFKTKGDEKLNISVPAMHNINQARQFDETSPFMLKTDDGSAVHFEKAVLKKDGMQLSRNLVNELKEFNATGNPAAIESRAPFAALMMNSADAGKLPTQVGTQERMGEVLMSEQMLHYWFKQADPQTRQRFLDWAARSVQKTAQK